MNKILNSCCGIDVHKKNIVTCVMYSQGSVVKKEIRTFGTMTADLQRFSQWLTGFGVTDVVLESTGVYWMPTFSLLEADGFNVILANARNVKNVPGRKTDCKDCEWLCKLLRNGLVEKSFIPPANIRDLRTLVRHRDSLIKDRTRCKNRILKVLESCNVKLSSVLTDCFGKSGWCIIEKLTRGNLNIQKIIATLPSNIKSSSQQFTAALQGVVNDTQRRILGALVRQVKFLDKEIKSTEQNISLLGKRFESHIECLVSLPGVDEMAACAILGEIGSDMTAFPDDLHLTSWACICPGNHESAGKRYSTHIRKGCSYLKSFLVQIAWAASKTKTYLGEKYRRLAARKGRKKALIALGRKILVICYHMLSKLKPYQELGIDYLDKLNVDNRKRYYVKQLEKLGYRIDLEITC